MNWALLQNSLLVSGLTTVCAVIAGFVAALWFASLERRWRNRWLALAIIALVLPPFLVTNCWQDLLAQNAFLGRVLGLSIYSIAGTIWVLTLLTWPATLLLTLSAWRRLQASQLESDPALGGFALVRFLLWPMARNSVALAAILTFVLSLNNFAVPTILQVKVFPVEAWLRYYTQFDVRGTLLVSWPLILAPFILIAVLRKSDLSWPRPEGDAPCRALRQQLSRGWHLGSAVIACALLILSVAIPCLQLIVSGKTWVELPKVLHVAGGAAWNSFGWSAAAATTCVVVALLTRRLPIGLWLWLPLLIPGILLGMGIILVFNRPGLQFLYPGAALIVFAWALRYGAIAWHTVSHAMQGVDRDHVDAARLEGASVWVMLRHVQWPQIAPLAGAGWYVTYLLCLWDVETLILIMPPGGETLSVRVFNLLHYGHTAQVNALCLLLLVLALLPLGLAGAYRAASRL